jgi:hypothetical protein
MANKEKPKTDINESLCCISLRYIQKYQKATEDDFVDFVLSGSSTSWNDCLEDVEILITDQDKYKKTYENYTDWIIGSYRSAKKIVNVLGVSLNNYIISKPEGKKSKAYIIKEACTDAIKSWAKEYKSTNAAKALDWSPGILSSVKSDKINISDIMLIKKDSKIYEKLEENQELTSKAKAADLYTPGILSKLITPKNYIEILNDAWRRGEIYGISLKKIDTNNSNVPAKILNYSASSANQVDDYTDEFQFFITNLIGAAKSGKSYSQFEKLIKKSIELEPVTFTSKDRLEVKYKFNMKIDNQNKSYDYVVWTNFGQGTNSVYFQQVGSGSASGEGGITLSYFYTLCKEIPQLGVFIKHLKSKRMEYFLNSCQKYNINYDSIKTKMGSSALSSGKYDEMLYTSDDFKKLVYVLLTNIQPINEEKYTVIRHGSVSSSNFISKNKEGEVVFYDGENEKVTRVNYKAIQCLEYFFKEYVDFLSSNNNQMGRYFGVSSQTVINIVNRRKKIQEEFQKLYASSVQTRQSQKFRNKQSLLKPKERIKGATSEETKKLKQEEASKIQLEQRTHDMFKRNARSKALKKFKEIEPQYKKSFALLANAEFGYMYSEHAEKITELVKKQVLLSLYAAASGRGYIIFDGKKFEIDDYFQKDIQGAPFLKIGM